MATGIAVAALVVAILGLLYNRTSSRAATRSAAEATRSADAAERSAQASELSSAAAVATDQRQRTPRLTIEHQQKPPVMGDLVVYRVRNDGPQDLDAVVIYRPRVLARAGVPDGIKYPLAVTGKGDFADDEINLGPLRLAHETLFTFCCGSSMSLPEFRVRMECWAGKEWWPLTMMLPQPR